MSSLAFRSSASPATGFLTTKPLSFPSTGHGPPPPPSDLSPFLTTTATTTFFHLPSFPLLPPPLLPSFVPSESSSSSSGFISSHSDLEEDDEDDVTSSTSSLSSSASSSHVASSSSLSSPHQTAKNGPLDSFDAIASALPIKRGLSRYFGGKSQSFSCLARVSSVADLAKPENPFAKRRKMAWQISNDAHPRHSSYPPTCGAISKRSNAISSRSHLKSPRSLASFRSKCLSVSELQEAEAAI